MSKSSFTLLFAIALIAIAPTILAAPDAADRAVLARLNKTVTIDAGELTLQQAIETITEQANVKTKINWPALEIVGIDPKTTVWLNLKAVAAEQVLQIALDQASADAFDDDKAGFAVRDGRVVVSTRRQLKTVTKAHDYSIRKYLAAARGAVTVPEMVDLFIELININVGDPDEWLDEESTITENKGILTVKTSEANHAELEALFDMIDRPIDNARDLHNKLDAAAEARLKKRISHNKENAPLSEVIDAIRDATGLNIAVNWPSLELVSIEPDAIVAIQLERKPASELLRLVLEHVSADAFDDDKAGYLVHDGIVYIDTLRMHKSRTETQVYKLSKWVGNRASSEEAVEQVIEAVSENVGDPDEWLDEESTMTNLHGLLVVKTTRANHHKIAELLGKLRR